MHLIFTEEARQDIKQIQKYRYRNSKMQGIYFISKLITYIRNLAIFPEMGRLIIPQYYVRKLVYRKYNILYQINYSLNLIRIIKIIQPKQNINLILNHIQNYL